MLNEVFESRALEEAFVWAAYRLSFYREAREQARREALAAMTSPSNSDMEERNRARQATEASQVS